MSNIKTDKILGSRRISNYWWATVILLGGLGFFLAGLSSYLKIELLPFTTSMNLLFIPQGIIMTFYGTIAILISIFLWFTIAWNVGSGYNEFNNEKGLITIFRLGFPGRNRVLKLQYNIQEIQSVRVIIQDGLTPRREIYLKTKDQREIPLTRVGQPLLLSEIEDQATSLAKFLGVVLEGID
uniref:Photosystem I assembly protein Ycf4 n=2 Tax=Gelidium TaxID=2811 RepID=A0A411FST3_9FLOR|nr:photosystem I assembly protein Ycf4 [Gelidium coulteri]YP_009565233.1 photosystem I assembly protein Ycf4 [Gelidium sinicola]QBA96184.1 photosystem I assembly protein Ycf4 [Gelidium coulteri]QBA96584.1 photosystem I assembly protein Ycf4 [Gelidium sinicola]